jgi:acetyltransferase-like isoleucine patch superfamily enzyme
MLTILRNILSFFLLLFYRLLLANKNTFKMGKSTILFARLQIKGMHNEMSFGSGCTMRKTTIQVRGNNNKIIFANNVKVYENLKILIESNNCVVKIEKSTTIGSAKIQLGEKETKVTIGADCMLSRDINTSDFHSMIDANLNVRINPAKDVKIGNHVWIGNGVYINKGAMLDDDTIVAAKSVVPGKNFEKNSLIGGVPAKIIKSGINWDRKII